MKKKIIIVIAVFITFISVFFIFDNIHKKEVLSRADKYINMFNLNYEELIMQLRHDGYSNRYSKYAANYYLYK